MTPGDYKGPNRRRGGPDRRDPSARVKILLVDDHAMYRMGMRQTLDVEDDFDVVAEADDSRSAIDAAAASTPDIVLLWEAPEGGMCRLRLVTIDPAGACTEIDVPAGDDLNLNAALHVAAESDDLLVTYPEYVDGYLKKAFLAVRHQNIPLARLHYFNFSIGQINIDALMLQIIPIRKFFSFWRCFQISCQDYPISILNLFFCFNFRQQQPMDNSVGQSPS